MAKQARNTQTLLQDSRSLRLRAAWLYHNRGLTQQEIAENLGVSRSTVLRMLDEALKRSEVQVWINETPEDCVGLALELEKAYGLDEAIVVPGAGDVERTAREVGAALGQFLSTAIGDADSVGVAWGRTLDASLATFRAHRRPNARVISLLGSVLEAKAVNPAAFSWRLAGQLGADCILLPAPLIVDSPQTRKALVERCGLQRLFDTAGALDIAVVSCGDVGKKTTSLSRSFLTPADYSELVRAGAVCDALCHFLDEEGNTVDHPLKDRVMAADLDAIAKAKHIVLASGGAQRVKAIRAAIRRIGCNTLITNEAAAAGLLKS